MTLGQDEGLTSHSTFAHSSFTTCDDDDLLDTSYFRFLGRCSSSGDGRRRVRVASWDTLWTEVINSYSGWLDGRTSGFSWERTLAETCRALCGRRRGRKDARGTRGRCIMVEWGDVCKVTRAKSISVITVIILGFVRHFPISPRLSILPHHQTLRAPHQTPSPHHHSLRAHHPAPAARSSQSYIHDLTVHSPHTHLPNTFADPHTGISVPSPFSPAYT